MLEHVWEIPDPLALREVRLDRDTVIALRRHGNPHGPRLVLGHGSGLAIDLYYPFWSLLADEYDLVMYDLRNHGWNPVGPRSRHNIPTLTHDHEHILVAIDRHFGNKPKIGVYHSVSALIALLSSATTPIRGIDERRPLAAQVLLDPTLSKPRGEPIGVRGGRHARRGGNPTARISVPVPGGFRRTAELFSPHSRGSFPAFAN